MQTAENVVRLRPVTHIDNGQGGIVRSPECRMEGGWIPMMRRRPSWVESDHEVMVWRDWIMRAADARYPIFDGHPNGPLMIEEDELFFTMRKEADAKRFRSRREFDGFIGRGMNNGAISIQTIYSDLSRGPVRSRSNPGQPCANPGPTLGQCRPIGIVVKLLNRNLYIARPEKARSKTVPTPDQPRAESKQGNKEQGESESPTNSESVNPHTETESHNCPPGGGQPSDQDLFGEPEADRQEPAPKPERGPGPKQLEREFDQFWQAWTLPGTKRARGDARKAFVQARKRGADLEPILAGVKRYMAACKREARELQFIKHPGSWLRAERYDDDMQTGPNGAAVGARTLSPYELDLITIGGCGYYTREQQAELQQRNLWPVPEWAKKQLPDWS